jgi:predicted HTH transcriptional regulator
MQIITEFECTNRKVFEIWKEAARQSGGVKSFCQDCLPGYKARMTACGKCTHPEIKFREDEDGFVEGFSEKIDSKPAYKTPKGAHAHLREIAKQRTLEGQRQRQIREHKIVLSLHRGPMTAKDIVRKTEINESTVYKDLNNLMKNGLVIVFKKSQGAKLYKMGMIV